MAIAETTGGHVNEFNDENIVYIRGDADTEGSIRFVVDNAKQISKIEKRRQGIWQPSSMRTGPNSVFVGERVALGAAGHHLVTEDTDGHSHFHVHSIFDGETTTGDSTIINAFFFEARVIFQPDDSGEFTGLSISKVDAVTAHTLSKKFYFKTGATAATEAVRIQTWEGTDDTGAIIFDQTYPFSDFPANTEISLDMDGYVEFDAGTNVFTTISSPAAFSLKTDAAVLLPWLAADLSLISDDDVLQTFEWMSGNSFDKGVWSIQNNKIYEANETGIQSGTFDDNLEKWDQLISVQGFDRVLTTVSGEVVPDNIGNLVISN